MQFNFKHFATDGLKNYRNDPVVNNDPYQLHCTHYVECNAEVSSVSTPSGINRLFLSVSCGESSESCICAFPVAWMFANLVQLVSQSITCCAAERGFHMLVLLFWCWCFLLDRNFLHTFVPCKVWFRYYEHRTNAYEWVLKVEHWRWFMMTWKVNKPIWDHHRSSHNVPDRLIFQTELHRIGLFSVFSPFQPVQKSFWDRYSNEPTGDTGDISGKKQSASFFLSCFRPHIRIYLLVL